MPSPQFVLFLPQMRMSFDDLVARARAAEAAGFTGLAGMDHLAPPMADQHPMYEAMVTTTWLAAHTERLRLGSLVLCDAFRHPAVLAKEAVSIDHASNGRFELGIGWGSVVAEFPVFGVGPTEARERVARLRESLEIVHALWAGETVDHTGEFFTLAGARQEPTPLSPHGKIPIVIGGVGPKTLALVRDYADWWNVDVVGIPRVPELRDKVGDARVSIQQMVQLLPSGASAAQRDELTEVALRRFRYSNPVIGTADELVDHYGRLAEQGIERVYTWFCDFAPPPVLAEFGETVIRRLDMGQ
jgi:alkanesulfonate monooxygenase SsuD/methylene tetrahydromethanopterin reductase-like flavin-dependent oxidoreductase (luciferase family)